MIRDWDLPTAEFQKILEPYGVQPLSRPTRLLGGLANHNYLIESKIDTYVLTIFESKSQEDVHAQVRLLNHLSQHKFTASLPVSRSDGHEVSAFQGHPVLLRTYLKGQVPKHLDRKQVREVGTLIAKLHQIPPPKTLTTTHEYGIEFIQAILASPYHPDAFFDWLQQMNDKVSKGLGTSQICLIHGDVFTDNIIVSPEGRLVFIDFEEACLGPRAYDLGMTLVGTCISRQYPDVNLISQLIEGYQQITSLDDEELRSLKYFATMAAMGTTFWRYNAYFLNSKDPAKRLIYQEMQAVAEAILSIPDNLFVKLNK